jgi:hypothetical protein
MTNNQADRATLSQCGHCGIEERLFTRNLSYLNTERTQLRTVPRPLRYLQKCIHCQYIQPHSCSRLKLLLMIPACVKPLNNGAFDTASVAALETIQEMADNICASVAYNSGDRMTTDRIDDKTAQHPLVARLPVPGKL